MMTAMCYCTGACRVPPYRCPNAPPLNVPEWTYSVRTPMGCICPPTSEQTCEAPLCPRKNPLKHAQGQGGVTHPI